MDIFELVTAGDADGVAAALRADPALAGARHPSGASVLAWTHYAGQPQLAGMLRGTADLDVHDAIICGDTARVRSLLDAGHDASHRSPDGFPPLALAAFLARTEIFDLLLPRTLDLDAAATNDQRVTALHAAAARRQAGMIEKLLRAGASPDLRQAGGFTPLHATAQNGDAMSTALLLLFGADVTARTDDGRDTETLARAAGHGWLAERLSVPRRPARSL